MYRLLFALLFLAGPLSAVPKVIVSVAPTKYLVEKIGGDRIVVTQFVPAGQSPHSFEPTPKQLLDASQSALWFCIGEGFESKTLETFQKTTKIVSLRENLPLLASPSCQCHPADPFDPHIWLSIPLLKLQALTIKKALAELLPDFSPLFETNLQALNLTLDALHAEIGTMVKASKQKYILVTHPAFGYFCNDYGLKQLSIEVDGKEPTPKQMTLLLQKAKEEKIDRLILEPQHNTKGGFRVAQELGIPTLWLDPYKEDVLENLKHIAHTFTAS